MIEIPFARRDLQLFREAVRIIGEEVSVRDAALQNAFSYFTRMAEIEQRRGHVFAECRLPEPITVRSNETINFSYTLEMPCNV